MNWVDHAIEVYISQAGDALAVGVPEVLFPTRIASAVRTRDRAASTTSRLTGGSSSIWSSTTTPVHRSR